MTRRATRRSPCPLCGAATHPWIAVPRPGAEASVGLAPPVDPDDPAADEHARMLNRCEDCASAAEQGVEIDLREELEAVSTVTDDGGRLVIAPNRASWQAAIGGDGWAALPEWDGHVLLTPRGLELLLERNGLEPARPAFPPWGRNQRWLWHTALNGITIHPNFASDVLAGRLRPGTSRGRFKFLADAVASVLATPLVLLLTVPVEAVAALFGRGGRMVVRTR